MTGLPELLVVTSDPTPPYEQLRRQLAALIGTGAIPAGRRLPPLRQLAGDLGLAVGTVARTYRELESAGLVESRRGGGTRVLERPGSPATGIDEALRQAAEEFVRWATAAGATPTAITEAVGRALRSVP